MPDLQLLVLGKTNKTLITHYTSGQNRFHYQHNHYLTTYYQPALETFQMYGTYFKILKKIP
jgi:hypothetical protein